jgi:hypothetical protein
MRYTTPEVYLHNVEVIHALTPGSGCTNAANPHLQHLSIASDPMKAKEGNLMQNLHCYKVFFFSSGQQNGIQAKFMPKLIPTNAVVLQI